jgi:hypothetical protein
MGCWQRTQQQCWMNPGYGVITHQPMLYKIGQILLQGKVGRASNLSDLILRLVLSSSQKKLDYNNQLRFPEVKRSLEGPQHKKNPAYNFFLRLSNTLFNCTKTLQQMVKALGFSNESIQVLFDLIAWVQAHWFINNFSAMF